MRCARGVGDDRVSYAVTCVWLYRPRMHIVVCMCVQLYGPVTDFSREHTV